MKRIIEKFQVPNEIIKSQKITVEKYAGLLRHKLACSISKEISKTFDLKQQTQGENHVFEAELYVCSGDNGKAINKAFNDLWNEVLKTPNNKELINKLDNLNIELNK